jgi:murein L,D-transpeptidase YafK
MSKLICGLLLSLFLFNHKTGLPDSDRARTVRAKVWPGLRKGLDDKDLKNNSPIYIRIFKDESTLEIWVKSGSRYQFFKSYTICYFSGGLGPKTRSGDGKSPEGFYIIEPKQLNPVSNYYLAINVGYPNKLELLKGYTGDAIMVHGRCASIGCYAMTDPGIEEIYTMVYKAFESGQPMIHLDIFPFRMDQKRMKANSSDPYISFWKTMKPGYDFFEKNHTLPNVIIKGKEYAFQY